MARSAVALGLLVLACLAVGAVAQTSSTLQDPKNAGSCLSKYQLIMTTLYANDTACQQLITTSLNVTSKAQCPEPSPIQPGTKTHLCFNKNGTQTYIDRWTDFVKNCEIMYVANRQGAGESEEGLTYSDNSCFPVFRSFSEFQNWLGNAAPYGGSSAPINAAGSHQLGLVVMAASLLSAFFFL